MDEKELMLTPEDAASEETVAQAAAVDETAAPCADQPDMDETADQAQAPAKKVKIRRRLFINADVLEWMSTAALAVIILFGGYLVGLASQAGYTGGGLLKAAFSDWYNILYAVVLAVFAVLCSTVCKKNCPLWLGIPTGVYAGMTVFAMYQPVVIGYALLYAYSQNPGDASSLIMVQQMMLPVVMVLGCYVLQLLMLISFVLLLGGKGNRWVHLVLTVLWLAINVLSNFPNLSAEFNRNAPLLMLNLSFVVFAVMMALPAICGKRVPACELADLQAEYAARKTKKDKVEEPADGEAACADAAEETAPETADESTDAPDAVAEPAADADETPAESTEQ